MIEGLESRIQDLFKTRLRLDPQGERREEQLIAISSGSQAGKVQKENPVKWGLNNFRELVFKPFRS